MNKFQIRPASLLLSAIICGLGTSSAALARDTIPPTVPGEFAAQAVNQHAVRLSWQASQDNFGVERYHLMRDGAVIAKTRELSYIDSGLEAGASYTYDVMADDGENYSYISRIIVTIPVISAVQQDYR